MSTHHLLLTAEQVLAIPLGEPERLFTRRGIHNEYREMMKSWHPDRSKHTLAAEVAAHITILRKEADRKDTAGTWQSPNLLEITGIDKKTRRIPFRMKRAFELGTLYYSPKLATFVIDTKWADLVHSACRRINTLPYRDAQMKAQMFQFLPLVYRSFESTSAEHVVIMSKTDDVVLLADLLRIVGTVPLEHAAWIINSLYNTACYFQVMGITHNGLDPSTIFVSPEKHSTHLLGGWWYSADDGHHLNAVASFAEPLIPSDMLASKIADHRLDLALIKAIGREILGDRTGMTLYAKPIPKPMVQFLRSPSSGSAVDDYTIWSTEVLPACFGKRRFVKWDISPAAVYR